MTDRSEIEQYDFNGSDVRVTSIEGQPWFVARDVGAALGMTKQAVSFLVKSLPEHFKGSSSTCTLGGGVQKVTIISYEGVVKMLIRSRKPKAEEFQDWLAFEVVPSIREKGYYFSKPMDEMERIAEVMGAMEATARHMIAQRKQLSEHGVRIDEHGNKIEDHEGRICRIETKEEMKERLLQEAERSNKPPKGRTLRSKVVELVRAYCIANGLDYRVVWGSVYREYRYRYSRDLVARARKGKKPLDVAEDLDAMEDLFSVATHVCKSSLN